MSGTAEINVSIIVPIFNAERYLRQCLDSLVHQTLAGIEIIGVNDGSTDSSLEILTEYARNDRRVRVISRPNKGYAAALNKGLAAAGGEYIGMVDADDYVKLDMFEKLYTLASRHRVDLVKGDFYFYSEQNGVRPGDWSLPLPREQLYRVVCPLEVKPVFVCRPTVWSGIYRRAFLREHKLRFLERPRSWHQDIGFVFKVMALAGSAYFTDEPLAYYRQDNPNSSTHCNAGRTYALCGEFAAIERWLRKRPNLKRELEYIKNRAKHSHYMAHYARLQGAAKKNFSRRMCREYKRDLKRQKIQRDLYDAQAWADFELFARGANPDRQILRQKLRFFWRFFQKGPKVSVILPVCNTEKYLRSCLESVLAQTLKNFECICVDDGSTDCSAQILADYAEKDRRIKIISQANTGPGGARNTGLKLAAGEYIFFLDSDDFLRQDALELSYDNASRQELDVLYFDAAVIFENDRLKKTRWKQFYLRKNSYPDIVSGWAMFVLMSRQADYCTPAWLQLTRREHLNRFGLRFPERAPYYEDRAFALRCILLAERVSHLGESLYYYHIRENSVLSRLADGQDSGIHVYSRLRAFIDILDVARQREHNAAVWTEINKMLDEDIYNIRALYVHASPEQRELLQNKNLSPLERFYLKILVLDYLRPEDYDQQKWP
ncbi:MAG: glycosyltransferase [Candidatus Margulisbacteria bacterium]|jgi:glycosyltransferase involved in cell wall biosynthesis|nr:glycosyltransferase [Candidatus Margulisiibacteriota bacterium]